MNSLREDKDEFWYDPSMQGWVQRQRRAHGIKPGEAACWFVYVEQDVIGGVIVNDRDAKWLGSSPADALSFAGMYADARSARHDSTGRWTLEVWGDGENSPTMLIVVPHLDEEQ